MRLVVRLARLVARLARLEIAEIEKHFSNPYNRHILSVLRDFSRISIYHSLSLFVTLYHSADMAKIKAVTSQRRSKTKGASPPPLQGEEPADIARTAALQFKGETKMRQCDDVILSESEPLGRRPKASALDVKPKGLKSRIPQERENLFQFLILVLHKFRGKL